ncbi:hypothetical protein [Pseudomonas sp. GL-B-19]|uniref:hypothetical protein n=1 Tax=Pseudomonas sp. GL-B-19 TaxID=2832393 RepID=UPI001CBE57BE|nr:hypothetical protein [Pseudomonas sp. GL-B-19]
MQKNRIRIEKCRVIFFDLEFYVPENSRSELGFCYNPWDKGCKFLGGSFLVANPEKDFHISKSEISRKTQSLWLWGHDSERELLERIYLILKTAHDKVRDAHGGTVSPVLCGIGITSSDIPILFELFKRFQILTNQEAFKFQNSFRVVDLSQLAISTFNNPNNFLYPKTKSHILNKYMPGTKFETGKTVWQLYESKSYEEIQQRVVSEIFSTHRCYELIKADLEVFKCLELRNKKLEKSKAKTVIGIVDC